MPQTITVWYEDETRSLELPDTEESMLSGVCWGRADKLFTPAFWALQVWLHKTTNRFAPGRLGETLVEEIAACVLGGYGMPAELGLAAFYHLRQLGLLSLTRTAPTEEDLFNALKQPFLIRGKAMHYRFARQRSRYLSLILNSASSDHVPEEDGHSLRQWLLHFEGVGPKTASWVTRNWLESDEVAIIDVHVFRACVLLGLFQRHDSITKNYFAMEARFLEFARCLGVRPSVLDGVMWHNMRKAGPLVNKAMAAAQLQV